MKKEIFDTYSGRAVHAYTLESDKLRVKISDFGATILEIAVLGGKETVVTLGFNSTAEYVNTNSYVGATIGRVANRIHRGQFTLGGVEYHIPINCGVNASHGGLEGFDKKFYAVSEEEDGSLTFSAVSEDGEQGFPGRMEFAVNYSLDGSTLMIKYSAVSDKDTLWVPTNHSYFNLDGEGSPSAMDTILQINADYYTPLGSDFTPTGEMVAVSGTPFDFRRPKAIERDIDSDDKQIRLANGYDHNFVLNKGGIAARAYSEKSGISLELKTDMPCLQFYTANGFGGFMGRSAVYKSRSAFCLEPQFTPDAINLSGVEAPILKKGEKGSHYIKLKLFRE